MILRGLELRVIYRVTTGGTTAIHQAVFVTHVIVENRVTFSAPTTGYVLTENVFVTRIKDSKDSSVRIRVVQAGHLIATDMVFVT